MKLLTSSRSLSRWRKRLLDTESQSRGVTMEENTIQKHLRIIWRKKALRMNTQHHTHHRKTGLLNAWIDGKGSFKTLPFQATHLLLGGSTDGTDAGQKLQSDLHTRRDTIRTMAWAEAWCFYLSHFLLQGICTHTWRKTQGLDPKSWKCIFIGYTAGVKGHKLYDLINQKMLVRRDFIFIENVFDHPIKEKGEPDELAPAVCFDLD